MPSPRDARPAGAQVSLLVLHNISLPRRFGGPASLFLNRLDYGRIPGWRGCAACACRRTSSSAATAP